MEPTQTSFATPTPKPTCPVGVRHKSKEAAGYAAQALRFSEGGRYQTVGCACGAYHAIKTLSRGKRGRRGKRAA